MARTGGREWALLAASVTVSAGLGLLLIRWLAPGLLGVPIDLEVVQLDERVVPFYENVFRREDFEGERKLIHDPIVGTRAKPMIPNLGVRGPTDLLGFRNVGVPRQADVVVIGDSQTYGTNAPFARTWPQLLARRVRELRGLYTMAIGSWGAAQYLYMFDKAQAFRPRAIVVAFYAGNDARESFRMAYNNQQWAFLRPDPALAEAGLPPARYPVPERDKWMATLANGTRIVFTPGLRLSSNLDHPGVAAGWDIMLDVAGRIADGARLADVEVLFVVIPTKERVYAERLAADGVPLDPEYERLLEAERRNVSELVAGIRAQGTPVVDLWAGLSRAALEGRDPYPTGPDGHPNPTGHEVIATRLAGELSRLLQPDGEDRTPRTPPPR